MIDDIDVGLENGDPVGSGGEFTHDYLAAHGDRADSELSGANGLAPSGMLRPVNWDTGSPFGSQGASATTPTT